MEKHSGGGLLDGATGGRDLKPKRPVCPRGHRALQETVCPPIAVQRNAVGEHRQLEPAGHP
ncbi:MAG: hypothetical protein AAB254_11710, partial [candidate division NC10 bacterium]